MKLLALYWGVMLIGYFAGSRLRGKPELSPAVQRLMTCAICILCFIMGLRMGADPQVVSNLGIIGVKSLAVTVFCVGGSMAFIFGARKILRMDRYGNLSGEGGSLWDDHGESESGDTYSDRDSGKGSDIRMTVIIVSVVAAGMLIGVFGISRMAAESIMTFDSVSSSTLVVCLCILLALVGTDMGITGTVTQNIKKAGWRVIVYPFAAVIGSIVIGTAACLLMGFSLKEGLAVSAGFGWFSYAPAVISGAGQQYAVAGAVSFMHNVMREMSGIIFIPLAAKKIGYLESTGIPGVAAMDVCMPIVERSCRQDTVVYSFATGLFMCVVTSVCVPLFMGM